MDNNIVANIINQLETASQPIAKLYFVQKSRMGYTAYAPNVTAAIYADLLDLIKNNLSHYADYEIIDFNPTGYRDMTVCRGFYRFFLRAASLAGLSSPEKGLDLKIFFTISFPQ